MDFRRSSIVFVALVICSACAQRPFYASGGGQYPGVLPQNTAATDVDNRFGENNTTPAPYKAHDKDPVYNVDKDLVERIKNEYPPEKQPYWYVNAAQINSSRYQQQQIEAQIQELSAQLKRLQDAQRANARPPQQQQSRRIN